MLKDPLAYGDTGGVNYWPNDAKSVALHPDLRWLIRHQRAIVNVAKARPMDKPRPIIVYPSGRVRIEFVKTYGNFAEARATWEPILEALTQEVPQ